MSEAHIDAFHMPPADQVQPGLVVFRLDTGTCHRATSEGWADHPVAEGTVWLTPDDRLVVREDGGWKPMGA